MKQKVRFIKKCEVKLGAGTRAFRRDEVTEIEEEEAKHLIREGLALPGGLQYSRPIRISEGKG